MMMKSPDEIKRNIVTCMELNVEKFMPGATQKALDDALALIQQLEKEKDDLLEERELNDYLRDKVKQLEAERDAAVEELANSDSPCDFCKYLKKFAHETPCNNCVHVLHGEESQFKWRGVQKEDGNA